MEEKIFIGIDIQSDFVGTGDSLVMSERPIQENLFGTVKILDRKSKFTVSPDVHHEPWPPHCIHHAFWVK